MARSAAASCGTGSAVAPAPLLGLEATAVCGVAPLQLARQPEGWCSVTHSSQLASNTSMAWSLGKGDKDQFTPTSPPPHTSQLASNTSMAWSLGKGEEDQFTYPPPSGFWPYTILPSPIWYGVWHKKGVGGAYLAQWPCDSIAIVRAMQMRGGNKKMIDSCTND